MVKVLDGYTESILRTEIQMDAAQLNLVALEYSVRLVVQPFLHPPLVAHPKIQLSPNLKSNKLSEMFRYF